MGAADRAADLLRPALHPCACLSGAASRGASPLPVFGYVSPAHVEWCYTRYRSYRLSDNSFQPHRGVRRACRSPYY